MNEIKVYNLDGVMIDTLYGTFQAIHKGDVIFNNERKYIVQRREIRLGSYFDDRDMFRLVVT